MSVLDQFRLEGRRALITGGTRGLGLEMARALAEVGAEVIVVGRDGEHLQAAVAELSTIGPNIHGLQADLDSGEAAERMCAEALERFAPIDILINNIGGRRVQTPTEQFSLAEWQKLIDLNLTQMFVCTKLIGGAMLPRKQGRIINISSICAFVAGKLVQGGRSYETAKAAVAMFTKSVAADWAQHGVTVNAIAPGTFLTDANRRWIREKPEFQAEIEATVPMGRMADPREIAGLTVYMASEASSFMTGSVVVLDGGRLLW